MRAETRVWKLRLFPVSPLYLLPGQRNILLSNVILALSTLQYQTNVLFSLRFARTRYYVFLPWPIHNEHKDRERKAQRVATAMRKRVNTRMRTTRESQAGKRNISIIR